MIHDLLKNDFGVASASKIVPALNTCNCKKSKCLKLYCDCFAFGRTCGTDCNCQGCENLPDNAERQATIDVILDRNP